MRRVLILLIVLIFVCSTMATPVTVSTDTRDDSVNGRGTNVPVNRVVITPPVSTSSMISGTILAKSTVFQKKENKKKNATATLFLKIWGYQWQSRISQRRGLQMQRRGTNITFWPVFPKKLFENDKKFSGAPLGFANGVGVSGHYCWCRC